MCISVIQRRKNLLVLCGVMLKDLVKICHVSDCKLVKGHMAVRRQKIRPQVS